MSGERPKRARLSNEVLVKPVVKKNLLDMPDLPILHIASFLDGKDLLNFTHTCQRFYHIYDRTWQRLYSSSLPFYKEIADAASTLVAGDASAGTTNVDKLTYFMHVMTKQNWKKGRLVQRPGIGGRNGLDGRYFKTRGREGVGILEFIEDEESDRNDFIFSFWDVKSGNNKTFPFNAPLAVDMLNDGDITISRIRTNGRVLIIQFLSESAPGFVALKLDDTDLEAKDLWQTSLELDIVFLPEWRMDSEENMLNVFNRIPGPNDATNLNATNLHSRGFSLQTGAQLWSQVINDTDWTPNIIASEKNWIVLGLNLVDWNVRSKIYALDKVQNSHKILLLPNQNDLNQVFDLALAVQQGKVLGLGNTGTAIIWSLVSGEVLHQVEHSVQVQHSLPILGEGKILQFDPTKLQFTLWVNDFLTKEKITQTIKMKPGGVGFEIIDQKIFRNDPNASGDMLIFDYYCFSEVGEWEPKVGEWELLWEVFRSNILLGLVDSEYNKWNINIRYTNGFIERKLFIAPTFVAFEVGDKICVNDFLNVAHFT